MELLKLVLDTILEYLRDGSFALVLPPVVALALGVILAFRNRKKLILKEFTSEDQTLAKDFADFNRLVQNDIRTLIDIHLRHQDVAGDLNIFRDLAPQSSEWAIAFDELVPDERFKVIVRLALRGFGWLMRPPTVHGLVSRAGDTVTVRATIHARGEEPYPLQWVSRPNFSAELKDEMARELGLKVIIHQSPHITVGDWQALDKLSEAIKRWPKATQASQPKFQQTFEEIEAALLAAQQYDPSSPLVNFNLGLLYYYRYKADDNAHACELFRKASRTADLRLKARSKIGVARCYCQDYHRFGKQSQDDLNKARNAAAEALKLTEQAMRQAQGDYAKRLRIDYARALYCWAFAQHITEKPEDIERGIQGYEQVIEVTDPDVPAFVYNNMGYILMARAGRFVAGGDISDYEKALECFDRALEREPNYTFALANRGNVKRLRGNYSEALGDYREAVEIDPNYANGWNEMAWVYLEAGQPKEAEAAHQKALSLARSDGHRSKLKELYSRALYSVGRHEEVLRLAREAQALNPKNATLNEWLAEIEGALS